MIVSASYRTDIPAFYGTWFLERLAAGSCRVDSPYGGRPYEIPLTRERVDGFVFWTRNAAPFEGALKQVAARGLPFVVHYTITGFPRPLETSVIAAERSVATARAVAGRYGARALVWRYDPLFITSLTPPDWHRRRFAELAAALAGATDEVVLSFANIYRKTRRNSDRAALRHGFTWSDPEAEDKRALIGDLAAAATDHGLKATLCAQPDLLCDTVPPARCIDAERLSDLAGAAIAAKTKGNRPGCLCAESRDIGAYDTCPHGCVYCYAVRRPELAKQRYREHDASRDSLAG